MNPFESIKIGNLALRNNLIAAPMAGLSSLPYRILAMEMGCALAISEMVSAEGAIKGRKKTKRFFDNDDKIRPFGVQLFGAKPEAYVEAIESFVDEPIDLIDINMGCPVKKVCKKGAGSALMRNPKLVAEIVTACRKTTKLPLTVKIRAGWDNTSINCVEIAKIAEENGADAVSVHGRTRQQEFRGKANWSYITRVKKAVSIPVIGNGDIKTRDDALRMLSETKCDGIMIGRAAVGNPWIFKKILDENFEGPDIKERGETALRHLEMLRKFIGDSRSVMSMKAILPWYTKGIPGVRAFMGEVQRKTRLREFREKVEEFFFE